MIAASLFSGIGAPEVAMPHWQWAWHAEIERFPAAVMAKRHPHSVNLGDVTKADFVERAHAIARPDVLVFGSPCQSYSIAGKRLGLDDPRGNLTLTALRIVARLEPRWFVLENVPDLVSSWSGAADGPAAPGSEWQGVETSDFAAFLGAVDAIGYHVAWTVLDAQYAGLAQRRERLFAVGHHRDWRYPAAVLFEPEGLCGYHPPRRETRQGIAPTLSARTRGGGGLGTDLDRDGGLIAGTGSSKWVKRSGGPAGDECYNLIAHALTADGFDASEDGTGRGTPLIAFDARQSDVCIYGDLTGALDTDGTSQALAFDRRGRDGGAQFEGPHDTANIRAASGGSSRSYVAQTWAVRRLTPRECERLMGLPDDYTLIAYRGKPTADGPRYKALGNSMAVPVVRWVLDRIGKVDGRARS